MLEDVAECADHGKPLHPRGERFDNPEPRGRRRAMIGADAPNRVSEFFCAARPPNVFPCGHAFPHAEKQVENLSPEGVTRLLGERDYLKSPHSRRQGFTVELHAAVMELLDRSNVATDGTLHVPGEYLEIVITKRR